MIIEEPIAVRAINWHRHGGIRLYHGRSVVTDDFDPDLHRFFRERGGLAACDVVDTAGRPAAPHPLLSRYLAGL